MFVNFDNVIKKDKASINKLPDAFVDYLSKSLPKGTKYKQLDDGICVIVPADNGSLSVGGLTPKLSEHQKKILGKNYSKADLIKYVNNSQKAIELIPIDGENIVLNGEMFSANKFMISPKNSGKNVFLKEYIYPEPFPAPHKITLSVENLRKDIYIHRVTDDSVNRIVFESVKDEYIIVKIHMDEIANNYNLSISIVADNIQTVQEVIIAMKLYNAFLNGSLCFDGLQLKSKPEYKKNYFAESTINYWEKLNEIERILDLNFKPDKENVSYQTANEVEKLYQSLVNKNPVIAGYTVESVDGEWDLRDDIETYLGKELFFKFSGTESFELYGENFELPYVSFVFNCIFNGFEQDEENYKIRLSDVSKEKPSYTSTLFFPNDGDLDEYDVEENILKFRDAKKPSDYM